PLPRMKRADRASKPSWAKQIPSLDAGRRTPEANHDTLPRAIPSVPNIFVSRPREGREHIRRDHGREKGHAIQEIRPCSFGLHHATTFDAYNQSVPPNSLVRSHRAVRRGIRRKSARLEVS